MVLLFWCGLITQDVLQKRLIGIFIEQMNFPTSNKQLQVEVINVKSFVPM